MKEFLQTNWMIPALIPLDEYWTLDSVNDNVNEIDTRCK